MKLSIQAGSTSQTVNVFIQDSSSTTGAGLAGLVFNSAGLTAYYALPRAAAASITLATLAAVTSAYSSGGFKEVDATNMPGWYRFDIPDAALASGRFVGIHLKGATNMAPLPLEIELTAWNNQDGTRGGMTALPNAAAEAAGGLYTRGTGAGQIKQDANGRIDANVVAWKDSTAPAMTGDAYARLGAPAGASVSADVAAVKTDTAAIKTKTDSLTFTVAGMADANVVDWKGATAPAMTGDSFARLGAPAGASHAADVAAVKTETASIQADTNDIQTRLPAALVSGRMDSSVGAMAANTLTASALATDAVSEIQSGLASQTSVDTIDDFLDTEIAAIKAKTDNLPASPAAVGSQMDLVNAPNATAVTAIQSGLATASALSTVAGYIDTEIATLVAGMGALTVSERNSIADALFARSLGTEGYAADGAVPTFAQFCFMMISGLFEFSISGTTITAKKLNGSDQAMTFTLDSATAPTSRTRAS